MTPHQHLFFNTPSSKSKTIPKKSQLPEDLLAKQGSQSFIKYSKPFISEVSVLGKVMSKFMMTLISSRVHQNICWGLLSTQFFFFKIVLPNSSSLDCGKSQVGLYDFPEQEKFRFTEMQCILLCKGYRSGEKLSLRQ